jgi:hypothetical protein
MRSRDEKHHHDAKQAGQREKDHVLGRTQVDDPAADLHVPDGEPNAALPVLPVLEARKLELLRVRDVRHDDLGRRRHMSRGSGRGHLPEGSGGQHEADGEEQAVKAGGIHQGRKNSGSITIDRK